MKLDIECLLVFLESIVYPARFSIFESSIRRVCILSKGRDHKRRPRRTPCDYHACRPMSTRTLRKLCGRSRLLCPWELWFLEPEVRILTRVSLRSNNVYVCVYVFRNLNPRYISIFFFKFQTFPICDALFSGFSLSYYFLFSFLK